MALGDTVLFSSNLKDLLSYFTQKYCLVLVFGFDLFMQLFISNFYLKQLYNMNKFNIKL